MIYKNGKEEKQCDCCGRCVHFLSSGYTVSETEKKYLGNRYADVVVGECELPEHEFDPYYNLHGVEHYRWETHTPCLDFEEY